MKTIGLIGGMTPESTKVYYELLIQGARQSDGDPLRNPEILIYSLNPTEIPLVISDDDLPIQVLDTTKTHIAAILTAAS